MRFVELSKKHQEFLMYCLLGHIKSRAKKEGVGDFVEPTFEEYKSFFDEFDGEYEIIDGCPESNACNRFSVKFKVVLEIDK